MSTPSEHALVKGATAVEAPKTGGHSLLAVSGIAGALASISCCILPLALFSVGITGAWMGNLTALSAYQPYFLAFTFIVLGIGFYKVYRKPQNACEQDSYCAKPSSNRVLKVAMWITVVMVAAALIYPLLAPWLLDI